MPVTEPSAIRPTPRTVIRLVEGSPVVSARPREAGVRSRSVPSSVTNGVHREQAHFPAEQPSAGQDPRLSPADVDPRRARHPRRSPPQGPREALRLIAGRVLPARHRLRRPSDFAATVRAARSGSRTLVVHARRPSTRTGQPVRVGFVVSKAVGNAVVRNRTKRRLRALVAQRIGGWPSGVDIVVRAAPPSAAASFAVLGEALDASFERVLPRVADLPSKVAR